MALIQEQPAAIDLLRRIRRRLGDGPVYTSAMLVAWELCVRIIEVRSTSLPSPSRVILEFWRQAPQFRSHALITLLESLEGLLMAGFLGLGLSCLAALWPPFRRVTGVMIPLLMTVPAITLAPLMIIWFGYGFPSAAASAFLVCLPPLLSILHCGFRSLPSEVEEILHSMGAGRTSIFLRASLPASLPYLSGGLKISVPLAFAGAAVAEFVGSDVGLGYMLQHAGSTADTTLFLAALTALILIILALNSAIGFVEKRWIPWPADVAIRPCVFFQTVPNKSFADRAR